MAKRNSSEKEQQMKIRIVEFLLWLADRIEGLLERYDICCYPKCENRADFWCITGGHRCCWEHESGYYSDVEMCQTCFEGMAPEEIAQDQKEQAEFEAEEAMSDDTRERNRGGSEG